MSVKEQSIAAVPSPNSLADKRGYLHIKGARRANNLKNVDPLVIPKNKLVVVTGVSGSGKSSITMDTLYTQKDSEGVM